MKRKFLLIILILIVTALTLVVQLFRTSDREEKELLAAIDHAAEYLVKNNESSGQFIYRVNTNPEVHVKRRYNLLRHAGTMYSLKNYYDHKKRSEILASLLKNGKWLEEHALGPILIEGEPDQESFYALWSQSRISGNNIDLQAKLGGAGLGLVALCGLEKLKPGSQSMNKLNGLAQFIVFMQKKSGQFYAKFIPATGGRNGEWISLYYPGEAVLGLLEMYDLNNDQMWLDAALRGIRYLAKIRQGRVSVEADHWVLIATAKIFENRSIDLDESDQKLFINHAIQICNSILKDQITESDNIEYIGSFSPDGRTTPAATRLEGLLSALKFLPESESGLRERIKDAVTEGIEFLLRAQLKDGEYKGGMTRAIILSDPLIQKEKEVENKRVTEIRIDYVQHALSAWLLYYDMIYK